MKFFLKGHLAGALALAWVFVAFGSSSARAQNEKKPTAATAQSKGRVAVRMAEFPALSPDARYLAFDWKGDIWIANSRGGRARRLTQDPGNDTRAQFSPDGKTVAFTSNRDGSYQVYTVPVAGGLPQQLTHHSEGSFALDWYPDGQSLLVRGVRDDAGRYPYRFFRVAAAGPVEANAEAERPAPVLLFDATGREANLSANGQRLLFTREGMDLYRKGYHGSRSAQIWVADALEQPTARFRRMSATDLDRGARSPQWLADGSGYYYLGAQGKNGVFELRHHDIASKTDTQITDSDGAFPVLRPRLCRDGSTMVFQRGFDLYRLAVGSDADADDKKAKSKPQKISLWVGDDGAVDDDDEIRRILSKASNLSFSSDGLEIAFIAGGDLWVMDTVLREPRRVTATPEEENEPIFSPDDKSIFYIRDAGRSVDVWRAERAQPKAYWWLNDRFKHTRITKDGEQKQDLQSVPGGKKIAFIRGLGDLWTSNHDGSEAKRLIESWNPPSSSWSPDGRWIAYSLSDNDFNRDIWIRPVDGSREPFNVSRHPDYDSSPTWSPDGKILAFTGRRVDDETDIYYVWLTRDGEQVDKRERTLREAVEKMKKERKASAPAAKPEPKTDPDPAPKDAKEQLEPKPKAEPEPKPKPDPKSKPEPEPKPSAKPEPPKPGKAEPAKPAAKKEPTVDAKTEPKPETPPAKQEEKKKTPEVKIDFEGIYERIHRISIPNSRESGLFWAFDSKRLAFSAEVKGVKGTYMVSFPDKLTTPAGLSSKIGGFARWIAKNDTILWLVDGRPSTLSKGKLTQYPIRALQTLDQGAYRREAFEQVWRIMRDQYYDAALNHLDWDAIHDRYIAAATDAPDDSAFDAVVDMLLGELNGSHLGFTLGGQKSPSSGPWKNETAHLGLRFDRFFKGQGLKITAVFSDGPADRVGLRLEPGDRVTHIDGRPVKTGMDLSGILNGPLPRDVRLTVVDAVAAAEKAKPKDGANADDKKADDKASPPAKPKPREIRLRPISYSAARDLANADRIRDTRAMVEELSGGTLGYVYVPKMQWDEFVKFEEEIYARGAGRNGLVIDVRDNGGGFTADHLLTVLTPSEHAFTVPRGGGPGYPQDRRVYATWSKPIVVLCNQNSFSNAEIFAHAVKTLRRGKLVGVTTAGGVISTGSTGIMDVGVLRLPFRGWFGNSDGEDMELNGAVPHATVRNFPQDTATGRDRQVEKAVQILTREVKAATKTPRPKARPASGRTSAESTPAPATER